jgi:uncharacterized protein (DUF58 family)
MLKEHLKKWVFLLVIMLSALIIGLKVYAGFYHLFFWFLVSIVVMNLVWIAIQYFSTRLHLVRTIINRVQEDETLEVETLIRNDGLLPAFNLVLEDNLSCAKGQEKKKSLLIEYLGAGPFLKKRYNCACPVRGRYKIGPLAVYFFDPLGLFFLKRRYQVYSELYVYPRTFSIKKFPDLIKGVPPWFGLETSRVSGDEDEFFGIREYKEGDPIKKIHWISTARKNQLIVKQFQRQTFFRATIVFNLEKDKNFGEGKERIAEYIIKIAASVAKYLIEKDISLELIANTGEMVHIPFNRGPEHLGDIFKFLALAQAESRVSLGEIFEEYSRGIPNDTTLIVIMPDTDWRYLPMMLPLEKRNISLVPLILISSTFLYPFQKQEVLKYTKIKLSKLFNFTPILFSRGDNLEEIFLKC